MAILTYQVVSSLLVLDKLLQLREPGERGFFFFFLVKKFLQGMLIEACL